MIYSIFSSAFFSLSIVPFESVHIAEMLRFWFFFYGQVIFYCVYMYHTSLSIHLLINTYDVVINMTSFFLPF